MNPLIILTVLFLLFCILRIPVPFALGLSSLIIIFIIDVNPQQLVFQLYSGIEIFPLLAIPFFLLAGYLLNDSGITEKLVRFSQLLVGRFRGGLAHVNVLVSMIFGGISGSSTADAAATGSVLIPAMKKGGYSASFSAAITAASSTMGNLIPPSIYMIIYGSLAGVSIEKLFMAGLIPGILIGLTQMAYSYFYAKKNNIPLAEKVDSRSAIKDFLSSLPALLLVIVVIGGIISGWFTATEASVVAVVYTLILALFFYRTVKFRDLPKIFIKTTKGYGAILFTIGIASIFGWLVGYMNGPKMIGDWIESITQSPVVILLIVAGMLLITGTLLSEIATIIIFMPIFLELQQIGQVDPIQMGIVVIMMLCLGLITPPVGVSLLIATELSEERFTKVVRDTIPLIVIFALVVLLIIFIPEIILFIPNLAQ